MKRKNYPKDYIGDDIGNFYPVISDTEFTGLIPFAPENDEEISAYEDIYDVSLIDDIDNP